MAKGAQGLVIDPSAPVSVCGRLLGSDGGRCGRRTAKPAPETMPRAATGGGGVERASCIMDFLVTFPIDRRRREIEPGVAVTRRVTPARQLPQGDSFRRA